MRAASAPSSYFEFIFNPSFVANGETVSTGRRLGPWSVRSLGVAAAARSKNWGTACSMPFASHALAAIPFWWNRWSSGGGRDGCCGATAGRRRSPGLLRAVPHILACVARGRCFYPRTEMRTMQKRAFRMTTTAAVMARHPGRIWLLLIRWAQRARRQAETPPIVLCRFPGPALSKRRTLPRHRPCICRR
jgi:hypothetical protein